MAALQFVDEPGYNAILFRRTYEDLSLPGALMDRAFQWLGGTEARWNAINHTYTFPSNARLAFGYLKTQQDKFRYQSSEFQFIGFDETTQFLLSQYTYLFSRLRRLEGTITPVRMRSASNPGNIGHDWVKLRLIDEGAKYGRVFIPAKLDDNPNLDRESYIQSLNELDPITRAQYLRGDWTAKHGGNKFQREWFKIVTASPVQATRVRFWDMAATTPRPGTDPDYTVGAKVALAEGVYYIEDIIRGQKTPRDVENTIHLTARLDRMQHGHRINTFMETEPGSQGIALVDHYARNILTGFAFWGVRSTGDKELRANPVSSAAQAGNVKLVEGMWIGAFLDEAEGFPLGEHDDQIDAVSGAFDRLSYMGPIQARSGVRRI